MDSSWKTVYYAIQAEKAGFDHLWVTDHFYNRNLWVTLSLAANYTSRIRLGPAATNPYLCHPVLTAQAISTLNDFASGRVVCGVGRGDYTTLKMLGVKQRRPLSAVRETVQIIRSVTRGKPTAIMGRVFEMPEVKPNFKCLNPVPVYVAAQGPMMLALAGEIGDGVLIDSSHPDEVSSSVKCVEESLQLSHKKRGEFDLAAYTISSIDEDPSEAEKAVRHVVAFVVAGSSPQILERHGITVDESSRIRDLLVRERWSEALSRVTPQMISAFSICGTPKTVLERYAQLSKSGVTQIVVGSPIGPMVKKSIELVRRAVLPHLDS